MALAGVHLRAVQAERLDSNQHPAWPRAGHRYFLDLQYLGTARLLDDSCSHGCEGPMRLALCSVYFQNWLRIARYDRPNVTQDLRTRVVVLSGNKFYMVA